MAMRPHHAAAEEPWPVTESCLRVYVLVCVYPHPDNPWRDDEGEPDESYYAETVKYHPLKGVACRCTTQPELRFRDLEAT
jgi:hypothetical protein